MAGTMKAQFTLTITFDAAFGHEPDVAMALAKAAVHVATKRWSLVTPNGEYPSGAVRDAEGHKIGEWEVTSVSE